LLRKENEKSQEEKARLATQLKEIERRISAELDALSDVLITAKQLV
jgi:hypothetical protein